jgi:hypothetical protein
MGDAATHLNGAYAWVGPSFEVVPYEPAHLRALKLQRSQAHIGAWLDAQNYAERLAQTQGWTALDYGRPVACAGFEMPWEGRAVAWAILGDCGHRMHRITTAVRQALVACPAERIEAYTAVKEPQNARWAKALGFTVESRMTRFCRGDDYWCFVRLSNTL